MRRFVQASRSGFRKIPCMFPKALTKTQKIMCFGSGAALGASGIYYGTPYIFKGLDKVGDFLHNSMSKTIDKVSEYDNKKTDRLFENEKEVDAKESSFFNFLRSPTFKLCFGIGALLSCSSGFISIPYMAYLDIKRLANNVKCSTECCQIVRKSAYFMPRMVAYIMALCFCFAIAHENASYLKKRYDEMKIEE
jgi:hypothetical protein